MIVAVAERTHDRSLTETQVDAAARSWWANPLDMILVTPALISGPTKRRFWKVMGAEGKVDTVVNLMPPHSESGVWDRDVAAVNAWHLLNWAGKKGHRLVLLGRRVADAFYGGLEFCTHKQINSVKVLVLPHPSGRSRYMNSEENRERVRECLRQFSSR